jgi:hypothetical protein
LPRSLGSLSWMFSGRFCTKVQVQVQCASTVFSITWIRLQRTVFLLVSPIYARLRNAQRTLVPIKSSLWQESSLHCSLEATVSCPSFRFQVSAADGIMK